MFNKNNKKNKNTIIFNHNEDILRKSLNIDDERHDILLQFYKEVMDEEDISCSKAIEFFFNNLTEENITISEYTYLIYKLSANDISVNKPTTGSKSSRTITDPRDIKTGDDLLEFLKNNEGMITNVSMTSLNDPDNSFDDNNNKSIDDIMRGFKDSVNKKTSNNDDIIDRLSAKDDDL